MPLPCFDQLLFDKVEQQGEEHGGVLLAAPVDEGEVTAVPPSDDAPQVGGGGRLPGLSTHEDPVDLVTQQHRLLPRVGLVVQEEPPDDGESVQQLQHRVNVTDVTFTTSQRAPVQSQHYLFWKVYKIYIWIKAKILNIILLQSLDVRLEEIL